MRAEGESIMVARVEDHPGVLTKVATLFRRRGFNIASLTVGHSEEVGISRMTIVIEGTGDHIKQGEKQLYKLVEGLKVFNLPDEDRVDKELALVKIAAEGADRAEVVGIAQAFKGEVVDVDRHSVIVEITASPYTVNRFLEVVGDFQIVELSRTGVVSMVRGAKGTLRAPAESRRSNHHQ